MCKSLERKISINLKQASQEIATYEPLHIDGLSTSMVYNDAMTRYMDQLRTILFEIKLSKSSSLIKSEGQDINSFLERISPSVISGDYDDWSKFYTDWTVLFERFQKILQYSISKLVFQLLISSG